MSRVLRPRPGHLPRLAVGRTEAALATAIDAVAALIAFYGSTPAYLPVLEVEGWSPLRPELNALSKVGKFGEMRALIDEDMALHAIAGPA